jgi:hypothetical protein
MVKQPYTEVADVSPSSEHDDPPPETVHLPENKGPEPELDIRKLNEVGMAKRIVGIVVALLIAYFGYAYYEHYKLGVAESGAIHSDDLPAKSADSDSDSAPSPRPRPAVVQSTMPQTTAAAPAADSIAPNPANGVAFTGSGKYQVYRQGNLTWRVDTETGSTCILFATMEEWRKAIVYSHGCRNS